MQKSGKFQGGSWYNRLEIQMGQLQKIDILNRGTDYFWKCPLVQKILSVLQKCPLYRGLFFFDCSLYLIQFILKTTVRLKELSALDHVRFIEIPLLYQNIFFCKQTCSSSSSDTMSMRCDITCYVIIDDCFNGWNVQTAC